MESILPIVIGGLYAVCIYLMLRRSLVKLLLGLALLTNAANLLIFTAAGLTRGRPPLIPAELAAFETPPADPLPQALILTAIVIGFSILAFALVLANQAYKRVGTDDLDQMRSTET